MSKEPDDNIKPTVLIQLSCLVTLAILFTVSALTKTEIPLPIYGIIGGLLFGVSNIKRLFK